MEALWERRAIFSSCVPAGRLRSFNEFNVFPDAERNTVIIGSCVKKRSHEPCCVMLKIIGAISGLAGIGLIAFYMFTSNGEYALFGATSIVSACAGFCLANLVRQ